MYENLREYVLTKRYGGDEKLLPKRAIFIISSIGKMLATFATYPILTVRVRLQANKEISSMRKVLQMIKDLGLSGLYRGITAKLLQTILNNAFLMMTYERMRQVIGVMVIKALTKQAVKSE